MRRSCGARCEPHLLAGGNKRHERQRTVPEADHYGVHIAHGFRVTPDIGSRALAGLIGTFAVLYGVLALTLAARLRAANDNAVMSITNTAA